MEISLEGTGGTPWPDVDEDLAECIAVWQESGGNRWDFPRIQVPITPSSRNRINIEQSLDQAQIDSTLSINVGGVIFRTSTNTLKKAPFFDTMLRHVETGGLGTTVDECGRFFVDRSGELFGYILEYLRSSHWLLRDRAGDLEFIEALREEVNFFGLDSNNDQLPQPQVPEYVTLWQFCNDSALYVDCLEPTIREDPDHQGLFRICKYSGGLPLDHQTCTKRFKATSQSIQAVITYFALRGFSLQHVLEGTMMTHTTSADGQTRSGRATQYVLSKLVTWHANLPPPYKLPPEMCGGILINQAKIP